MWFFSDQCLSWRGMSGGCVFDESHSVGGAFTDVCLVYERVSWSWCSVVETPFCVISSQFED